MTTPKISFVIATFDRYELLKEAINSVINQKYDNYEVLVCSDGGSEIIKNIVKCYDDHRVKYLEVEHDGGWSARNIGIDYMGDFVVFLDDDNIIYNNFIETLLPLLVDGIGVVIYRIHLFSPCYDGTVIPHEDIIKEGDIDTLNGIFSKSVAKNIYWIPDPLAYSPDHNYFKKCEEYSIKNNLEVKYINDIIAVHRYFPTNINK